MSEALRLAAWMNEGAWHAIRLGDVEAAGHELRRLAGVEAELQGARDSYDRACKTVALMHAAAVGEMRGPTIGVVEDVEAVRAELQQAREERTALLVNEQNLREELAALRASLGEPATHQYQTRDGKWHDFIDERHKVNTIADGSWPIRTLFAIKDTQ